MKYPNIESERARLGITQDEIAERLDVTDNTYRNWITGRTDIPVSKAITMTKLFNCSMDYLVGLAGEIRGQ